MCGIMPTVQLAWTPNVLDFESMLSVNQDATVSPDFGSCFDEHNIL